MTDPRPVIAALRDGRGLDGPGATLIAQGLAAKRLDLVRAMVLSNTGAKIGTRDIWAERIDAVNAGGTAAVVDATMQRWFAKPFHDTPDFHAWRTMFLRCPAEGWTGCGAAIAGSDFMTTTAALRLPTLGIAGSEDGSTPPDLVRETVDLVPGSEFHLIRGAGHRLQFSTLLPKDSEAIDVLDDVRVGQRLVHALETLLHFAEAFEEPRIGPSEVSHGRMGPGPDLLRTDFVVLLLEALNPPGGVHKALLASIERMAHRADVRVNLRLRGHRLKSIPASAGDRGRHGGGVDILLHDPSPETPNRGP